MIIFYLGRPDEEVMSRIGSDLVRNWIQACGERAPIPWTTIIPKAVPKAADLLGRMLDISPWKRCSAEEALAHPYLEPYSTQIESPGVFDGSVELEVDSIERINPDKLHDTLLNESSYFQKR